MKRNEYLRRALDRLLGSNLHWVFSAFSLVRESADAYKQDPYAFRIVSAHKSYQFVSTDGVLEDIEGTDTKAPLFTFKEKIQVTPEWAPNIKEPVEVTIGQLIFNQVVILSSFGTKFPFVTGSLALEGLEARIAPMLHSTPKKGTTRDPGVLYIDEYRRFVDALVYMEQFSPLTNWSATRKGITAAPGIYELRDQLLKEYEGRLDDPVIFAEYEAKLKAFDKEYLKDDPAYGTFIKGKILDVARKKMFLSIGIPDRLDLTDPKVAITRTLEEGQPENPREYAAFLNGARFGSFSRGAETVNGGVVSKALIRVGSNFRVDMEDCQTSFGMRKIYTKDTVGKLVGRSIVKTSGAVFVENIDQANDYLGKTVIVRSPAYCQAGPGDRLCKVCSGKALSQRVDGLIIPLTEASQIILTQSLKAMHGKNLSTAELDLDSVIT